jgi:hypothetical protein
MTSSELLLEEIDNSHRIANDALKNKRFEEYIDAFGEDLKYKQLDGKTIGKAALACDIQFYFNRVLSYTSSYERLSFNIEDDKIVEQIVQHVIDHLRFVNF